MDYKRINGMIDIDKALDTGAIVYNEAETNGVRKNKFWFNDYTWMYKEVDNDYNTYEEYSEVICYELAKLLGIECAEYDLATYKNKKGVITRSIVKPNEKIVSGTELLNTVFEGYFVPKIVLYEDFMDLLKEYNISSYEEYLKLSKDDKTVFSVKLIDSYNQTCFIIEDCIKYSEDFDIKPLFDFCMDIKETYPKNFVDMKNGILISNNLYDIWSAVDIYCKLSGYVIDVEKFMTDLIKMFIFDIITNQGDRHADNWSIIISRDSYNVKLGGLYDNSGALALNREKAIVNIDDYTNRLKVEKNPNKQKGVLRLLQQTIEHSFSGLKITDKDVMDRSRNTTLIENIIAQSDEQVTNILEEYIELITPENINQIFINIESRTGVLIPDIVKNVTMEVLMYNINKIKDRLPKKVGDGDGSKKI